MLSSFRNKCNSSSSNFLYPWVYLPNPLHIAATSRHCQTWVWVHRLLPHQVHPALLLATSANKELTTKVEKMEHNEEVAEVDHLVVATSVVILSLCPKRRKLRSWRSKREPRPDSNFQSLVLGVLLLQALTDPSALQAPKTKVIKVSRTIRTNLV